MQISEWKWKSPDGLEMYSCQWTPEGKPKAVLVLVHGLGEHVGRYSHVGAFLSANGYALAGFDLRGHGKSGGPRGHTPSYNTLMEDITAFLQQVDQHFPSVPKFLYGHSLGGNLILNYAIRYKPEIRGVVATAPWLELAFQPPISKVRLARVMNRIFPSYSQGNGLDIDKLSRDRAVVTAYRDDLLVHEKISARMFLSTYDSGLWALENASKFPLPVLLMNGEGDAITSAKASREFAERAGVKATVKIWPGMYHEIHNEPEKEEVFKFMLDWLEKHYKD